MWIGRDTFIIKYLWLLRCWLPAWVGTVTFDTHKKNFNWNEYPSSPSSCNWIANLTTCNWKFALWLMYTYQSQLPNSKVWRMPQRAASWTMARAGPGEQADKQRTRTFDFQQDPGLSLTPVWLYSTYLLWQTVLVSLPKLSWTRGCRA